MNAMRQNAVHAGRSNADRKGRWKGPRPCALAAPARGFTLIEVLAALAVFGIVAAGLATNNVAVVRYNRVSHSLSAALMLAQDQVEQLRALDPGTNPPALSAGAHSDPSNPITALATPGGRYVRQWTVMRNSPAAGVSTVSVAVSWTDGGTRTVWLWAYVCQSTGCA